MNSIATQASGAVPSRDATTVAHAIGHAEGIRSLLHDVAVYAERLAEALGGVAPPAPDARSKGETSAGPLGMVDALNAQIDALRDPTNRIHDALSRIERRIG